MGRFAYFSRPRVHVYARMSLMGFWRVAMLCSSLCCSLAVGPGANPSTVTTPFLNGACTLDPVAGSTGPALHPSRTPIDNSPIAYRVEGCRLPRATGERIVYCYRPKKLTDTRCQYA